MKALAVIPARRGSKEVPGKNIRHLKGRPLIHYTLDAAAGAFEKADICVSTDSKDIADIVKEYGFPVPFIRPDYLATDVSGNYEVLLHAYNFYRSRDIEYDVVVMLQPTSPFRTAKHIREAMGLFGDGLEMVVSVKDTDANPYFELFEEGNDGFLHKSKEGDFASRQQCPKVWQYNGAVYVIRAKSLLKQSHLKFGRVKKYVMNHIDSLDIDTQLDWDFVEFLMEKGLK